MLRMVDKEYIRKKHFLEGWSIRELSRQLKISRQTVRKMLKDGEIPKYDRKKPKPSPVMDPYREIIQNILEEAKPETSYQKDFDSSSITLPSPKGQFTVLLLGADTRPDDNSLGNSDTIIVAHIDAINNIIALLSIPRDTQITMPNCDKQKINAVARLENGSESTVKTVAQLINQRIDGFILADFSGFKIPLFNCLSIYNFCPLET